MKHDEKYRYNEEQILKALERSGFPFEGNVAQILKNNKWQVNHGLTFLDKDQSSSTEKLREVDLEAYRFAKDDSNTFTISLKIVGECKKKKNGVVVLGRRESFKMTEYESEALVKSFECYDQSGNTQYFSEKLNLRKIHPAFNQLVLGQNLLEIDGTNPKEIKNFNSVYSKFIMPVVKAVKAFASPISLFGDKANIDDLSLTVYVPTVFVNGPIWYYDLEQEEKKIERIKSSVFVGEDGASINSFLNTKLPVMLVSEEYIEELLVSLEQMLACLIEKIDSDFLKEIRGLVWRHMSEKEKIAYSENYHKQNVQE